MFALMQKLVHFVESETYDCGISPEEILVASRFAFYYCSVSNSVGLFSKCVSYVVCIIQVMGSITNIEHLH
jgi:hypothetical protein